MSSKKCLDLPAVMEAIRRGSYVDLYDLDKKTLIEIARQTGLGRGLSNKSKQEIVEYMKYPLFYKDQREEYVKKLVIRGIFEQYSSSPIWNVIFVGQIKSKVPPVFESQVEDIFIKLGGAYVVIENLDKGFRLDLHDVLDIYLYRDPAYGNYRISIVPVDDKDIIEHENLGYKIYRI